MLYFDPPTPVLASALFCGVLWCAVQPRFRSLWERYCRGVQAIVYVVDAADHDAIQVGLRQQQWGLSTAVAAAAAAVRGSSGAVA
jgi:hypothetical protein